jgi:hypothetical protein
MRRPRLHFIILAGLLAAGMTAGAQGSGPGGAAPRGFSSQMLISQLSLYVPEEATRGMHAGFGGRPNAPASDGAAPGRGFPQIQFTRDPKLFLTKAQITSLLPILHALRDNPLPTPVKAKQVQADVDSNLTAPQKAEWTEFQKKLQALIQEFRQRMSADGTGAQGQATGSQAQDDAAPQTTLLQRRQKQLDAFIKVLQDRLNAGA